MCYHWQQSNFEIFLNSQNLFLITLNLNDLMIKHDAYTILLVLKLVFRGFFVLNDLEKTLQQVKFYFKTRLYIDFNSQYKYSWWIKDWIKKCKNETFVW